jgi:hypothetical protein
MISKLFNIAFAALAATALVVGCTAPDRGKAATPSSIGTVEGFQTFEPSSSVTVDPYETVEPSDVGVPQCLALLPKCMPEGWSPSDEYPAEDPAVSVWGTVDFASLPPAPTADYTDADYVALVWGTSPDWSVIDFTGFGAMDN